MIIDVHGHFTRAPQALYQWRAFQLVNLGSPRKTKLTISDDELEATLQQWNLKKMNATGIDKLLFSPHASHMGHHVGNPLVSLYWTQTCNDLIAQCCRLHPDRFIGVCQLPQHADADMKVCAEELERMVKEHGFVGCNLNPDPSGGARFMPSMADEYWFPLYEKMVELDVPAMIHASATQDPQSHLNACHYTNVDANAVVDYCLHPELWDIFPGLKIIVPHGGGATAFNYTRMRSIFINEGRRPFEECVANLWFDLAIYDEEAMEMTIRRLGPDRVLYATEMWGSAYNVDPLRGKPFDETLDYVNNISWLTPDQKYAILEGNARKVFSRARFD